jgi:hypothetical protein
MATYCISSDAFRFKLQLHLTYTYVHHNYVVNRPCNLAMPLASRLLCSSATGKRCELTDFHHVIHTRQCDLMGYKRDASH